MLSAEVLRHQTSQPHLNKYLLFDCCLTVSHPDCVCRSATACLQINYKQALDTEKKWFYTANIISNQRAACCCNFAAIKVVVVEVGNTVRRGVVYVHVMGEGLTSPLMQMAVSKPTAHKCHIAHNGGFATENQNWEEAGVSSTYSLTPVNHLDHFEVRPTNTPPCTHKHTSSNLNYASCSKNKHLHLHLGHLAFVQSNLQ